jgi:hypothetical protein
LKEKARHSRLTSITKSK